MLALAAAPLGVTAQEDHAHAHDAAEKLGTVEFTVSCTPAARAKFQRAVALLHSFAYELADAAFSDVLAADPSHPAMNRLLADYYRKTGQLGLANHHEALASPAAPGTVTTP